MSLFICVWLKSLQKLIICFQKYLLFNIFYVGIKNAELYAMFKSNK